MSRHPERYHWQATLASRFPKLPRRLVIALALWSLGMILARRGGLSAVALHLADRLGLKENSVRQRPGAGPGQARLHRVFALGLARLVNAWSREAYLLPHELTPEPWPAPHQEPTTLTEVDFTHSLNYP